MMKLLWCTIEKYLLVGVNLFVRRALTWNRYGPDIHCVDTFIIWNKGETRKCNTHQLIEASVAGEATDVKGAEEVTNGCGRKRLRDEHNKISAIRKRRRDRGESYSLKKHKRTDVTRKPARKLKEACHIGCRNKCSTLITEEERQEVFNTYWKIGNVEGQWQYIHNHISVEASVEARIRLQRDNGPSSKRNNTRVFTLNVIKVCKVMFLNTLSITDKVMCTALEKCKKGFTERDMRGTTQNRTYCEDVL